VPATRGAEGVLASVITPRRRGLEEIDLSALWELIDFLCSKKVDGIVLMGAAGEPVHFTMEERSRMMPLAVRRSRVPVLVNVSHSALDCALQLGEAAARAGAAGLLVGPPWFYRYDQADIVAFYNVVLEHLGKHVPLYLSTHADDASTLTPDTAAQLLASGYSGVEDGTGKWSWFLAMRERAAGRPVFIAHDSLFTRAREAGATGAISAAASAIPELLLALDRAVAGGVSDYASALDVRLDEFVSRSQVFPIPTAIREAVSVRNLKTGHPAVPLDGTRTRLLADFRDWFKVWLPQVQKEVQQGVAHA
jgi:dihydrodipicolinate synthase/N-acetylneuraminate lyase